MSQFLVECRIAGNAGGGAQQESVMIKKRSQIVARGIIGIGRLYVTLRKNLFKDTCCEAVRCERCSVRPIPRLSESCWESWPVWRWYNSPKQKRVRANMRVYSISMWLFMGVLEIEIIQAAISSVRRPAVRWIPLWENCPYHSLLWLFVKIPLKLPRGWSSSCQANFMLPY